nr:unnamed protein product [Callosobruchus chinensis]
MALLRRFADHLSIKKSITQATNVCTDYQSILCPDGMIVNLKDHILEEDMMLEYTENHSYLQNYMKSQFFHVHLRTKFKEYLSNNKFHPKKSVQPYQHTWRYKCNMNISEGKRQELFKGYYDLPSYDHQTAFLSSCMKKSGPNQKKEGINIERKFSTNMFLLGKRVCKEFFLKTFNISNKRFTTVCAKTNSLDIAEPDRRGKGQIHRRMDNDKRVSVITHIKKFPRYRSHYSRKANGQTKYISSDLSMKIMYDCKKVNVKNKTGLLLKIDEAKITKTKNLLALHQKRAKKAIEMKKDDIEKYRHSTNTIVVCFDLQQALPTLLLTTSKGLPGNRVLINKICLPPNITRIIAYSDSCSGQNKN